MQSDDELGVLLAERPKVSPRIVLFFILGIVPIGIGITILLSNSAGRSISPRQFLGTTSTLPPFPSSIPTHPKSASVSATTSKLSLNHASQSALESLPGIGKTRATQIVEGRPYTEVSELREKAKLPVSIIQAITPYVSLP